MSSSLPVPRHSAPAGTGGLGQTYLCHFRLAVGNNNFYFRLVVGLTTLEELRYQTDMLQTFKILRGFDRVDSDTWSLPKGRHVNPNNQERIGSTEPEIPASPPGYQKKFLLKQGD